MKSRSKRPVATAPATPLHPATSAGAAGEAIARLERERDALKAELETARARIAELERQRSDALNRVEWVIDSLHTLSTAG